ncbi:RES family NAD+ phosphorylase [Bacillus sp. JJ1609]|uniref:RES family NAD+ phosphorylase n=1 Tax=Bacillus sp. JJ1609 TaxID=3122977 RepID=UPI002FFE1BAD
MSSEEGLLSQAFEMWTDFKNEILYRNRFNIKHEVLDILESIANSCESTLESGEILYRARIYTADTTFLHYLKAEEISEENNLFKHFNKAKINNKMKTKFWGYDEKDSFVPLDNNIVSDGRANPSYIKYLYTAEEPYTALVEVRPYLGSRVSIAEIKVNEPLIITDFSYDSFGKLNGLEQNLLFMIMRDFSRPSDFDKKSYIPTQYVSEFIKNLGLEGIKFNSSLHERGRNITIFNYEKCQAIGSSLYEVEDICFEAKGIAPLHQKTLIHHKIEPFKFKQAQELLDKLGKKNYDK